MLRGLRRRRGRAEHDLALLRIVLADELHHDVRVAVAVMHVEHANDVIGNHVARRARLGEHLIERLGLVALVEHLDRDVAAESRS